MKDQLKRGMKRVLARSCIEISARFPTSPVAHLTLRAIGMQLDPTETARIIATIRSRGPCKLLVFGLGRDSPLWSRVNLGGMTVFLEDDPMWFQQILRKHRQLTAHLVDYASRREEWRELLDSPGRLALALPESIERERWDVILIDGPAGFTDSNPGRMKAIAVARSLAARPADVFVHDCDREVEQVYCDRFLGPENLLDEVGVLRHYRINRPTGAPPDCDHERSGSLHGSSP